MALQTFTCQRQGSHLLPLDRPRRLAGDVVEDTVDAGDFVADSVGGAGEYVGGEAEPVGGHGVFGGDGAEGADFFVGAFVALDADGADGQQVDEGLPDVAVEAGLGDLVDEDGVGFAEGVEALSGDGADAAHA